MALTFDDLPGVVIARDLLTRGLDHFRAYVCENLGAPDERVTQGDLADIAEMEFSPLSSWSGSPADGAWARARRPVGNGIPIANPNGTKRMALITSLAAKGNPTNDGSRRASKNL